jgi:hypothetical protein
MKAYGADFSGSAGIALAIKLDFHTLPSCRRVLDYFLSKPVLHKEPPLYTLKRA